MTVNDILAKLYEVNRILDLIEDAVETPDGLNVFVDEDKLVEILEDYKAMLGNMKVKE